MRHPTHTYAAAGSYTVKLVLPSIMGGYYQPAQVQKVVTATLP